MMHEELLQFSVALWQWKKLEEPAQEFQIWMFGIACRMGLQVVMGLTDNISHIALVTWVNQV